MHHMVIGQKVLIILMSMIHLNRVNLPLLHRSFAGCRATLKAAP